MTDKDALKKRLRAISRGSAARTDALFEKEIAAIRNANDTDLEALRPKITDTAAYDRLTAIVGEASQANLDSTNLNKKIAAAGADVIAIAKVVTKLLI